MNYLMSKFLVVLFEFIPFLCSTLRHLNLPFGNTSANEAIELSYTIDNLPEHTVQVDRASIPTVFCEFPVSLGIHTVHVKCQQPRLDERITTLVFASSYHNRSQ